MWGEDQLDTAQPVSDVAINELNKMYGRTDGMDESLAYSSYNSAEL